ncbi:MAG: hypothetical protein PHN75_15665 [Syntrophales bacterium]|nr:hypothetical protein [Syntrophales bacterium]
MPVIPLKREDPEINTRASAIPPVAISETPDKKVMKTLAKQQKKASKQSKKP